MRPKHIENSILDKKVSIHASVKDATPVKKQKDMIVSVSIHASVKDATMILYCLILGLQFQSTHL